ncbi:hypothetical protein Ddye_010463 [Dipteronia dyeriana]|uniref:LOB domain-containing protein n=1 Tax=Dipteronia dyeriana TaxID=168575 RepID=A0AAD9XDW9_9ROSI|nr:hypothetical protein Ddye_010463 [Dipteronia dyeriana]
MIGLSVLLREEAVNSLVYEAEAWMCNPVYECIGIISNFEAQLKQDEKDLYNSKKELATYIGPEEHRLSQIKQIAPQQSNKHH